MDHRRVNYQCPSCDELRNVRDHAAVLIREGSDLKAFVCGKCAEYINNNKQSLVEFLLQKSLDS